MLARARLLYGLAGLVAVASVCLCLVDAILAGSNGPALEGNWLQAAIPRLLTGSLYGIVGYLLLLFPTGAPPSRRWWPVAWAAALFAVTMVLTSLVSPGRFNDVMRSNGVVSYWFPATNPMGLQPLSDLLRIPGTLARMGTYGLILVAAFAAIRRFRRSTSVERQQLKWLAYAGAVIFAGVVVLITSRQQVGQVTTALDIILRS